jgi:hypothetical protein
MTTVNPMLARFAAALNDAYEAVCDEAPDEFFEVFGPVRIKLYTIDGLTAEFYEEGIEFYPDDEN